MYVPTNDQILGKAQTLAKAAGKTDADWLDFSEQAKTDLIAEHDGEAQIAKTDDVPAGEEAPAAEAAPGADGEQAPEGEEAPAGTEAAPAGEEAPEAVSEEAAKADVVEPEQVWKAADGTTFAKKADCLTHNEKLAKAAPASLKDLVAGLQKTVAAAIDGEQEPQLPFDQLPLDQRLGKFADFLSEPDILAKGMYEVSRLSTTMRDCASLFVSVNGEAKREGDGSSVPGTILDAVGKLGEALIDMATEEVGELMSALRTQDEKEEGISYYYDDVYCHLAAQTLGLEKADATEFFNKAISISGKDMARLQKIHDHASALGATCTAAAESGDDAEVAAAGGEGEAAVPPAAKEEEDEAEKMAKAAGFPSENAMLKADLAKAQAEIDEVRPMVEVLAKQVADMLKKPQPRAAQTQVVEKGTGGEGVSTQSGEIDLSKVDPAQLAQAAIRMAQQNGRQVSMAR